MTTVKGSAGVAGHVPGTPATVSAAAEASSGIAAGNFIESEIDEELFRFNSDDTPLMNLMLRALHPLAPLHRRGRRLMRRRTREATRP